MQRPRVLTPLLFLAVAAVDVVVWTVLRHHLDEGQGLGLSVVLVLVLIYGQVCLLGVWSGLARRPIPWPLATTAIVMLGWSIFVSPPVSGIGNTVLGLAGWLVLLAAQAVAVAVPLWGLRFFGVRLVTPASEPRNGPDRPLQFSIAYLLSTAVALAVVLGLYRWTFQTRDVKWVEVSGHLGDSLWLNWGLVVVGVTAVTLSGVGTMLVNGRPWLRMAAPVLAVLLVIGAFRLFNTASASLGGFSFFLTSQAVLVTAAMAVLRLDGYRLGKQSGKPKAESGSPPEP